MSSRSKVIGTRAETKVARYLSDHGLPTKRKALAGSLDEGDLRMLLQDGMEVTLEVKAGKQTQNYNRAKLTEWKRQTIEESKNSGCRAMLVVVRHQRRFDDAEVWIPLWQWDPMLQRLTSAWIMMYIDDFVRKFGNFEEEMIGG